MNKIRLTNTSTALVYIEIPEASFNVKLAPSRWVEVTEEKFMDISYDQGFQAQIEQGFIKVDNLSELQAAAVPQTGKTQVTKEEVKAIYEKKDYVKFTKLIQNATPAAKQVFYEVAVDMKVTDNAFVNLIKKYCDGYDVIKAIAFKHEAMEE